VAAAVGSAVAAGAAVGAVVGAGWVGAVVGAVVVAAGPHADKISAITARPAGRILSWRFIFPLLLDRFENWCET
jgi:hypothetical protein